MKHDPYCKSFYPALIPAEKCRWCTVIREVRLDEYLEAWNEGFAIGYGEKSMNEDIVQVSSNADIHNLSKNADNDAMGRAIRKWEEDIDIAYWQGYNNAMVEMDEASAAGSKPTTTQKLSTLGFLHLGTTDYMCPFCVSPWKCNGPHIDEGDMENFLLYMEDRNAENND